MLCYAQRHLESASWLCSRASFLHCSHHTSVHLRASTSTPNTFLALAHSLAISSSSPSPAEHTLRSITGTLTGHLQLQLTCPLSLVPPRHGHHGYPTRPRPHFPAFKVRHFNNQPSIMINKLPPHMVKLSHCPHHHHLPQAVKKSNTNATTEPQNRKQQHEPEASHCKGSPRGLSSSPPWLAPSSAVAGPGHKGHVTLHSSIHTRAFST